MVSRDNERDYKRDDELTRLAIAAGQTSCPQLRNRYLTMLLIHPDFGANLWRGGGCDSDDYQEAYSRTLEYLCARIDSFDPTRACCMTWVNNTLRWKLLDVQRERGRRQTREGPYPEGFEPSQIAEPESDSLEEVVRCLERHRASFEALRMRGSPPVNGYDLIRLKGIEGRSWDEVAHHFQRRLSSLSSFYQRRCLPRLRELLQR